MTTADESVIQLAVERGLLPPERLAAARGLRTAASREIPAAATLRFEQTAGGAGQDREIVRALAEAAGLPYVDLAGHSATPGAVSALPGSFIDRHRVWPFGWTDGFLQVAVADPFDIELLDSLDHVAGRPVQPCLALRADIDGAIAEGQGRPGTPAEAPTAPTSAEDDLCLASADVAAGETAATEVTASDGPVIALVQDVISSAVARRASDIHLEPQARTFRVRCRVDGELVATEAPPRHLQAAIISRVKIMANMSIAERRLPQDGRMQVVVAGRPVDLRVSSVPSVHGESLVMRILDQEGLQVGLPELGLAADDQEIFSRLLGLPDGIVLVTGPTGSGKTTTLYSCLHHLNHADRKIITVEEPVEYQIGGINQVPVRADIGMTFASALRAMLRQAPNIVMVGEIRDRETAEVALNAALTGHLVFSTLHTNDAPGAVTRLLDLGAKPFVVAAGLRATVAQRLVRRVCPHCRREHAPGPRELSALNLTAAQAAAGRFARGAGCAKCDGTGYLGRTGIFEIFLITPRIRDLIGANASAARLRACAREEGRRTLRQDGLRKVLAGETTIEEVVSATAGDQD